jgi:PhoPQ-activated pathogenicity-related protein
MMPDWTWYPSVPITAVGRAMTQAACDYEQIMCELHVLTGHPASAWHTFIEAEWHMIGADSPVWTLRAA